MQGYVCIPIIDKPAFIGQWYIFQAKHIMLVFIFIATRGRALIMSHVYVAVFKLLHAVTSWHCDVIT